MSSENKSKVTVLGRTFNSNEERRVYYREELRKKLPELKNIEGFPIGTDEDILNLSDPPYYTACPNPWLSAFIEDWENSKTRITARKDLFSVEEPYFYDVSEGKYDPMYLYHPYPTKVPHKAIMKFILHFTQPGDIIFDGFAGTGMTGVAARICENPDNKTRYKIENEFNKLGLSAPQWGGRKCICSDLSPLATFIAYNYNASIPYEQFYNSVKSMLDIVDEECLWMYETTHSNGKKGVTNNVIWSEVFMCPNCSSELVFWDTAVDKENGKVLDEFFCPSCNRLSTKKNIDKAYTTFYDTILLKTIKQPKVKPVLINYSFAGKRYQKIPDQEDLKLFEKIENTAIDDWYPIDTIPDGDKTIEAIRIGITHAHHFYTKRNLIVLSKIRAKCVDPVFNILITKVAFQTTKLYRLTYQSGVWGAGGGPMSGTLYIPSLCKELNISKQIRAALKDRSKITPASRPDDVLINLSSANSISHINNNSIDYIFTDPPFGSNLMYSELNFLSESWLKVKTNNKDEAIENKTQNKTLLSYQSLMTSCFQEYYRILKPNCWMTVEFSNTSAAVWNSINAALQRSGFIIANVAGLDKQKGSYNAVNSPTAVKQDLVISCYKPISEFEMKFNSVNGDKAVWDFVEEHLHHLPIHQQKENATTTIVERSPRILFDRLVSFYIQRNLMVPIDAHKFQEGLRDRYIERDGMFFTNEQAQEYDRKKADLPNFIQMSIFVANEQDSIYWLRNILEKHKKTESDLHPFWMKEVAGNMRKGDSLPEMRTILEENFLKDQHDKWYVPDPENEVDLEKLRTKRLIKQFDAYKAEAVKPKAKIKEVRVEALRAGFKQCYQDKDFKTIVLVGDKIPNNLLMEDEVLLQFYDIASSRV